jgi:deazaflavin-dependent oxidoreductase (nitroreductase family)
MTSAQEPPKPDFMTEEAWGALMAARRPEIIRAGGHAQVLRYLETNGEGADATQGGPTLLLTTIGRKSGKEVITPVNYMEHGDSVIVVGSIAGLSMHPHWVLNLEKNPRGWVQIRDRKWAATARKVVGEERSALWPALTAHFPLWGHFQKYCDREFGVFILSPS